MLIQRRRREISGDYFYGRNFNLVRIQSTHSCPRGSDNEFTSNEQKIKTRGEGERSRAT